MAFLLCLAALLLQPCLAQFDPSSCGVSKGCLFAPNGCTPGRDCTISYSYVVTGADLEVELSAWQATAPTYAAVAFSKDTSMGDDSVVYCATANGQVESGYAFTTGKTKPVKVSDQSLQLVQGAVLDGNLYCKLRRPLASNNAQVFPVDRAYHVLLARGDWNNDDFAYHGSTKEALPSTLLTRYTRQADGQVTTSGVAGAIGGGVEPDVGSTSDKLKMAHGILMVLSWMVFLSSGILFARHFRGHFPDTLICGVRLWFHLHRTLNMIGIAATIASFVCIFVANDWQWRGPKAFQSTELNQSWSSIHSILGLLACVVAWAQPLGAVFRCHPEDKSRFVFNMLHRFLGFGAWLMAAAATMIATKHFNGMFSNWKAAFGLYIAFIAVFGITAILMEFISVKGWWSARQRVTEMEMNRVGMSGGMEVENRAHRILSLLMLAFVVLAIGLAVAIAVLIGLKNKYNQI